MSQPDFTVDIYQNEYLPEGGQDVNAVATVTAAGTATQAPVTEADSAEIIIIDCSGSMGAPRPRSPRPARPPRRPWT